MWNHCLGVDFADDTGWLLDIQVSGHLGGRGDSGYGRASRLCAVTCYGEAGYTLCEEWESGEYADLGVIGNAAPSEDVRFLKERMKAWEAQDYDWREGVEFFAGRRWQLGELQSAFAAFITSLTEYARFMELDYYARKLRFQEKQLGGQRSYLRLAEREYELIDKDIKLAESMYIRDSILYVRKAMIAAEFEESGSRYLQSLCSKEEERMSLL